MKYMTYFTMIFKDGEEITVPEGKDFIYEKFENAAKRANEMNEQTWKFHQDRAERCFYFVKEWK